MDAHGGERSIESMALDLLPDAVVLAEYDRASGALLVRYVNATAERKIARPKDQVIGRPVRDLLVNQAPFESRPDREAFIEGLRKAGSLEMPALMMARDASGELRRMRTRFHWPAGGELLVAIGEDVTERSAALQQVGAVERLRSARDISSLLGHYVNDALTVALMSIEDVRHLGETAGEVDLPMLAQAVDAIRTASNVLKGLSAATDVDTDLDESCDLEQVLRAAWEGSGQRLRLQATDLPRFVWGSSAQLQMILGGFLPLLGDEVEARIHGGEQEVLLQLRTGAALDHWLPLLMDPTALTYTLDRAGRSVRLFASVQVLHAIGGRLGMPSRDDTGVRVELSFRAAPGKIDVEPVPKPVLLVSGDGALRATLRAQLAPRPLHFTDDIREGMAWLMRPRSGVVICDADHLHMTPTQLVELQRMLAAAHSKRVILVARGRDPDPHVPLQQLRVPIDRTRLLELVAEAAEGPT